MRIYDELDEKAKEYIDLYCPYKIDDRLLINKLVFGCNGEKKYEIRCIVTDIIPRTYKDKFESDCSLKNKLDKFNGCLSIDEEKMKKFYPEFVIIYEYDELQPRSKWWKFWEERTYKKQSTSITVDLYGQKVESIFSPYIFYDIVKL